MVGGVTSALVGVGVIIWLSTDWTTAGAPPGGRKASRTLLASWLAQSLGEMAGFSMNLLCTIRAILSLIEGMSAAASDLGLMEVSPFVVAFTTAAVACTGVGFALLTEHACAGQSRQSEESCICASAGFVPAPISADTSKVLVSQYSPSLATKGLLKVMVPMPP